MFRVEVSIVEPLIRPDWECLNGVYSVLFIELQYITITCVLEVEPVSSPQNGSFHTLSTLNREKHFAQLAVVLWNIVVRHDLIELLYSVVHSKFRC